MSYINIFNSANNDLFIIAEAGVNHNGSLQTALRLVDAAVSSGCNAIKFQTWITDKVYSKRLSVKPDYQIKTTDASDSEYEAIKKLELSYDDFYNIKKYCDDVGITFLSTPDEEESAIFLANLGVPLFKVASQDVTNLPFLRRLSAIGLPLILSTGACTMSELAEAVESASEKNSNIALLHCVSAYPAPINQINLSVISTLASAYGFPVGFSDHTNGLEVACAAVVYGSRVFEKHLTLDRSMHGPDHQASFDPIQMASYCQALNNVKESIGDGIKRIMPCELNVRNAFRRYIVSARNLKAGEVLSEKDFVFKKVVSGIPPKYIDILIGRKLVLDVEIDTPIVWKMIMS